MTLLDLKVSTVDIDFTVPRSDKPEFDRVRNSVPHGFKIDGCGPIHYFDAVPNGSMFPKKPHAY